MLRSRQHIACLVFCRYSTRSFACSFSDLPLQLLRCGDDGDDFANTNGKEKEKIRFLAADHSINCDTATHRGYEAYAYFAIFVYVVVVPLAMMMLKKEEQRRVRASGREPGMLDNPYKPSSWWFDTFDLLYRLAMTGMLLLVYQHSAKRRMIANIIIALLYMAFNSQMRPFLGTRTMRSNLLGKSW